MADARQDENWRQTASVIAMLLNQNRTKGSDRWFTAADFPRVAPKAPVEKAGIEALKAVFCEPASPSGAERN